MPSGAIPLVSPGRLDRVLRQSFTSTHSVVLSSYRLKPRFRLGQLPDPCGDDFHDPAAGFARDRGFCEFLRWRMRHAVKQVLQQLDQRLAVAVQKPIIARPAEPFGQDVLGQQPEKLLTRQRLVVLMRRYLTVLPVRHQVAIGVPGRMADEW